MGLPVEKQHRYTVQEYMNLELDALEKHEYHDGEILAMSGGTYSQSLVISNLIGGLHSLLKGKPCRVLESNLRIRIPRKQIYLYPDASIICGKPQFDPQDTRPMTVMNPRVIIEVLSPSTEAYDRGEKFNRYREIDSLEEYILVSQDRPLVETFFRQSDGAWLFTPFAGAEATAKVRCLGIELPIAEIYAGVEYPAGDGAG